MVSTCLEFARTKLCLKEVIRDFGIRPVLNSPADDEGERGEYFPVYSSLNEIYIIFI